MAAIKLPTLVGVIHLPALAGAPQSAGEHPATSLQKAGTTAVREAKLLTEAGFDGLILENFGDVPFYKQSVPPETVASMAIIAAAIRESTRVSLGVNVLRNDARSALAIAAVTGCQFIRINVLSGVAATDQGLIESDAAFLIRERARLGCDVAILADAHVKHAHSLSSVDLNLAIEDLAHRQMADGVIITGASTGKAIPPESFKTASRLARSGGIRLYAGSGVTVENISDVRSAVHGIIVGSALRKGGRAGQSLDARRVQEFVRAYKRGKITRIKSNR